MGEGAAVLEAGIDEGALTETTAGENHEEARLSDIQDGNIDGLEGQQVKQLLEESRRLRESEQAVSEQHVAQREEISEEEVEVPGEEAQEPTIAELQQRLVAQEERFAEQEKFNARQSTELGLSRKKVEELEALKAETGEDISVDNFLENPREALRQEREYADRQGRIAELENSIQRDEISGRNRDIIAQHAPEFESQRESIAKLLINDGNSMEEVQGFMSDAYNTDPAMVIQLSRRAQLESENATLKARLKSPGDMLQKIDQAARRGPSVTARSGQSAPVKNQISMEDVDYLSPAEVKAELARLQRSK